MTPAREMPIEARIAAKEAAAMVRHAPGLCPKKALRNRLVAKGLTEPINGITKEEFAVLLAAMKRAK